MLKFVKPISARAYVFGSKSGRTLRELSILAVVGPGLVAGTLGSGCRPGTGLSGRPAPWTRSHGPHRARRAPGHSAVGGRLPRDRADRCSRGWGRLSQRPRSRRSPGRPAAAACRTWGPRRPPPACPGPAHVARTAPNAVSASRTPSMRFAEPPRPSPRRPWSRRGHQPATARPAPPPSSHAPAHRLHVGLVSGVTARGRVSPRPGERLLHATCFSLPCAGR